MWVAGSGWPVVAAVAGLAVAVLAARLVRARRAFTRALEERGWLLEREREGAARAAVDSERARIARELHDIVSHNVSVMVVQAGAARRVLDAAPEQAAEALLAVEAAGRDTMTELRHLLGVLAPSADGEDGGDLSPQPGLARLGSLVDRIAFAGLPVEVRVSGEPRPLPSGVDVTAYRVVQEALTNALKHGDGRKAEVTVRYAEHYLRVEVLNTGPSVLSRDRSAPEPEPAEREPAGRGSAGRGAAEKGWVGRGPAEKGSAEKDSAEKGWVGKGPAERGTVERGGTGRGSVEPGRGLLGLRERVAVFGGDLDARRRLGGGFRVRARIPLGKP
ncbi:sensor histidine kinase [Saccharothrix syringae]|uniref:histidine kinase n=1 Tax=Saccharothrix syringae TaxID=103733 RepID=A0A5Q0GYQ1_SACSY|nr:histidine kinase [Saccharothrix syringae]QFZ19048.1 sensor histidine kinase [Saccharothrix syringae]